MSYTPPWMPGDALDIGLAEDPDSLDEPGSAANPGSAGRSGTAAHPGSAGGVASPQAAAQVLDDDRHRGLTAPAAEPGISDPGGDDGAAPDGEAGAAGSGPVPEDRQLTAASAASPAGERVDGDQDRDGRGDGRHPEADDDTDREAAGAGEEQPAGRSALVTAGALAGIVACVAVGFAIGGGFGALGAPDAEAEAGAAGECVEEIGHDSYRGAGPGSPLSPTGVVAAFEHAYYVQRDAEAAVALTTAQSGISATHLDLDGISQLPAGTRHCVAVQAVDPQHLQVVLTELRPGQAPVEIHQQVQVEAQGDGGGYLIAGIEHTGAS